MTPYQARRLYFLILSCLKKNNPMTIFKGLSTDTLIAGQKGVKCAAMLTNPNSRGEFYRQFTRRFGNRILKEWNKDTKTIVSHIHSRQSVKRRVKIRMPSFLHK